MKISKQKLKQIIMEEIASDGELVRSMNKLTNSIENLDVSIDYLTSTVSGEDPFNIDLLQKGLGRFARPGKKGGSVGGPKQTNELDNSLDEGHGGEGSMARSQLGRTVEIAAMLQDMIQDESDLEEWVESKITKAQDYLSSVLNYMRGEQLSERVYKPGEKRPSDMIEEDLREVLTCYMQELVAMGHDSQRVAFGMERLISDIQISGFKGAQCDSMAIRPAVDPTDVPLRRVAEKKLTDAEYEKKKEIADAIEDDDPDMPDSKRYAIATAAAKKSVKKNRGKK